MNIHDILIDHKRIFKTSLFVEWWMSIRTVVSLKLKILGSIVGLFTVGIFPGYILKCDNEMTPCIV